jgi:hypothetical protein
LGGLNLTDRLLVLTERAPQRKIAKGWAGSEFPSGRPTGTELNTHGMMLNVNSKVLRPPWRVLGRKRELAFLVRDRLGYSGGTRLALAGGRDNETNRNTHKGIAGLLQTANDRLRIRSNLGTTSDKKGKCG